LSVSPGALLYIQHLAALLVSWRWVLSSCLMPLHLCLLVF